MERTLDREFYFSDDIFVRERNASSGGSGSAPAATKSCPALATTW